MTSFSGSIALFRHPEQLEHLWLARWDSRRRQFDFVKAERLEHESFRECLDRELAWTLQLRRGKDYLISSMARLHLEAPLRLPNEDEDSLIEVEFYIVDFYGRAGRAVIEEDPATRWLSSDEVLSGVTADGKPVAPSLVTLLTKADVIARHRS